MRKLVFVSAAVAALLAASGRQPAAAQMFEQHNLVSDGAVPADATDTNWVNSWGLVAGPSTPWWVANNGTGTSTLYNAQSGTKLPLVVTVPGAPTGIVFNGSSTSFVISDGTNSGPARFLFASEDGTLSGWNSNVPPPPTSTAAFVAVTTPDAVYKGLAIASTAAGDRLYATNFHAGTVDVFDSSFNPVHMPGAFTDPRLPAGYAPFGIANLGGTIYVTYALQDADKEDDVAGPGHGFVDAYNTEGVLLHRVASRGELNSPWGLAMAPAGLGKFSGNLLVGNFGNGRIHAFVAKRHHEGAFHHHGPLRGTDGRPLTIEGLWALAFGNGSFAGPTTTLFFTAGPSDENHGLFGELIAVRKHDDDD